MLVLWVLAGIALGFGVGRPPVQRTQEARVLETARQMRGANWRGWLVPRINGSLRLQKPPLAYWMAALAYDIGGVSTASGRIPSVICGWLTLFVTYIAARRWLNARAAFFSAATLLSSFLFFRHDRLAETDAPAALFVTIAIYAWWRALDESAEWERFFPSPGTPGEGKGGGLQQAVAPFALSPLPNPPPEYRERENVHPAWWFNLGAVATALAVMFKGGPGAFPPIFLLGMIALRRQWPALLAFVKSGALFLLVALALPWFIYARYETRSTQISGEVDTLFSGQDHFAPFYHYGPELMKAAAPWSFVVLAAVGMALFHVMSANRRRRARGFDVAGRPEQLDSDRPVALARTAELPEAGLLMWVVSILLPLCVIGNKQFHYLLPLMPPLMILAGWLLDRASDPRAKIPSVAGALIDGTILLSIVAAPLVLLAPRQVIHQIRPQDYALAAAIAIAMLIVLALYFARGRGAALLAYAICCAIIFPPAVGLWVPSLEPDESTTIAREIHDRFGGGPYVFYGPNYSLPLCFNLRSAIPNMRNANQLIEAAKQNPHVVVIAQSKGKAVPPAVPPGFQQELRLTAPGQVFEVYQVAER